MLDLVNPPVKFSAVLKQTIVLIAGLWITRCGLKVVRCIHGLTRVTDVVTRTRETLKLMSLTLTTLLALTLDSAARAGPQLGDLENPTQVCAGSFHTCTIGVRRISCWGSNTYGQSSVPTTLLNPSSVKAGGRNTCALDSNGVSCWGSNYYGQAFGRHDQYKCFDEYVTVNLLIGDLPTVVDDVIRGTNGAGHSRRFSR